MIKFFLIIIQLFIYPDIISRHRKKFIGNYFPPDKKLTTTTVIFFHQIKFHPYISLLYTYTKIKCITDTLHLEGNYYTKSWNLQKLVNKHLFNMFNFSSNEFNWQITTIFISVSMATKLHNCIMKVIYIFINWHRL